MIKKITFPLLILGFLYCFICFFFAALHKKRTTLAALSRESGLGSSTLADALSRP